MAGLMDKWLRAVAKSQNTKRNYSHDLNSYCAFLDKTPDKLIIEAEAEIKDGKLMRERAISDNVPDFIEYLENKKLAPNTIRGYIMAIQSFYSYYDIQFPKIRNLESTVLESNIEIPTKSDIQNILKVCDPLEKAVVLAGVSSGLSMNELINLKVGSFKNGYDKTGITTLKLRRGKTNVDFITFLTREASEAITDYLEYRDRKSDSTDIRKQKQLQKQHVYSNNDYLFIGRKIPDEFLDRRDEELRKLERNSFLKLYRMLNEKARKSTPKGSWNVIRSHNLRKYYDSALLNAGCDSFFVEYTMGHKINRTKASYFRSDPGSLIKIYEKFVPFLTIQKELDISESDDFKRIKAEHETLLMEAEKYRVEREEIKEVRNELASMKKSILEDQFRDLMFDYDMLKQSPGYQPSKKYEIHLQRLNTDPEYKKQFENFLADLNKQMNYFNNLNDDEFQVYIAQERERRERILKK